METQEDDNVTREQAARMLSAGLEWEAALFFRVYKELIKSMTIEEAKAILMKARYQAGIQLGREACRKIGRDDVVGLARSWEFLYGTDLHSERVVRFDDDRFTIRSKGCIALTLFERWGLSEDEIRFLADAYCISDVGYTEGFSEKIEFQHTHRLMLGDALCEWDFSMTSLEPSQRAINKSEIDS